jgi:hypothetical protein
MEKNLVILVPILLLLLLSDDLFQVGFQVFVIFLKLGPLFLGQDGLGQGELHGTDDAEIALVLNALRKTSECLLNVTVGFAQAIVPMQTWNQRVNLLVT